MNILANDGLSQSGITALKDAGFGVLTTHVAQEQLANYINTHKIVGLLIGNSTEINKDIIEQCSSLKLIGSTSIHLDHIDTTYAKKKGIHIISTPTAASNAVAELVFAHLLGGARYLHDANRNMPLEGDSKFKSFSKGYANSLELKGKTLGIIGLGKTGLATAKIALGLGMKVIYHDIAVDKTTITLSFFDKQQVSFELHANTKEEVLQQANFITLHIPKQKQYYIAEEEFQLMQNGVGIINTANGSVMDEVALVKSLESGKVAFAGLDVFSSEPNPEIRILMHPDISLTPHTGGTTIDAREKIGIELANQIISLLK